MCRDVQPRLVVLLCAVLCALCALCAPEAPVVQLRPECPPEQGHRCREAEYNSKGGNTYMVDEHMVRLYYMVGSFFELQCDSVSRSAEHPALPRFTENVRVRRVKLRACAPPSVPYARVLAALNVSVTDELTLDELPTNPMLRNEHFEGLHSILYLKLNGVVTKHAPAVRLPHALLNPMQKLRNLTLEHVQLGTVLEVLPVSLSTLTLRFTRTNITAPDVLRPKLDEFLIKDKGSIFVNVTGASALRSLKLASDNSSVEGVTALTSLEHLSIDYWSATRPKPWEKCGALQQLALLYSASWQQTVLPDGWVARCPLLSHLSVRRIPLAPLPSRLLENATSLQTLRLSECRLSELPSDLFTGLTQLTLLDLSNNKLQTLPRNLFISLGTLKILHLSNNLLTSSAARALQPLSTLTELLLVGNTQLSDLCDVEAEPAVNTSTNIFPRDGSSILNNMTRLTTLELRNTGVSRVCRDWREGMPYLKTLDLIDTNITVLKYGDVIQRRSISGATMKVGGRNHTVRLDYSFEDFERAENESLSFNDVKVVIQAVVDCNCNAYWATMAFRSGLRHLKLGAPPCATWNQTLRHVPIDKLTCAKPELCTNLHGCSCVLTYNTAWTNGLVTASCEHRGLTTVPGPLRSNHTWRLLLANNNITSVHMADLPPHLAELDLHNNPLRCDCNASGLLEIATWPERVNITNITCAVDSKLPSLKRMASDCPRWSTSQLITIFTVLLAVLAVVTLLMITVFRRAEMRVRIKMLFRTLGWLPAHPEDDEERDACDGRLFDAFVSYAHEDEEWVRETLVERLESGQAPFRLCVHYRDWAPGEWIPAQIAASVRASRRTIVIVSRHFLKSDWALLEFREAHAHTCRDVTSRLIVLLLEDPELLPLDVEMSSFIEHNTYVRWGDPWFWRKLEHAMPPRLRKPA